MQSDNQTNRDIQELNLTVDTQRKKAIEAIMDGKVVAGHMRRVFGFWIDASNTAAYKALLKIKGEQYGKKMSIMTTGSFIVPHIYINGVKKEYRKYVESPEMYSGVFGSICHTILPIKLNSLRCFPEHVVSSSSFGTRKKFNVVYNLDPTGHPGMETFISQLQGQGVIPAVTSMNPVLYPEITNIQSAQHFLKSTLFDKDQILMRDMHPVRKDILGSFAQVHLIQGVIERDGHIPAKILGWMLNMEIDENKIKKHKYPHASFDKIVNKIKKKDPLEIRRLILKYIHE